MTLGATYSLADLERFDPYARESGSERRFCCPLCGGEKPKDKTHRSVSVNTTNGAWNCHRCHAAGKLTDFWTERSGAAAGRQRQRITPRPVPPLLRVDRTPPPAEDPAWREKLEGLLPLAGSPAADYLERRGIPLALAEAAGVKFHPAWFGRPAVLFPIRNRAGQLVAAHGRHIDGGTAPKARSAGSVALGVFSSPGALEAEPLILVEGPMDALSLTLCGAPAVALVGTNLPLWLARACVFRRVLVATDADQAGDAAFTAWKPTLTALGARYERKRPSGQDVKDWNDELRVDPDGLRAKLRGYLQPATAEPAGSRQEDPDYGVAAWRAIGEQVPAGALPWATEHRPDLAEAAEAAGDRFNAALADGEEMEHQVAGAALVGAYQAIAAAYDAASLNGADLLQAVCSLLPARPE